MAAAKPQRKDAKPRPAAATKARPKADSDESKGAGEEAKRMFREALERKRSRQGDHGEGSAGPDSTKIHGAHGPAVSRREFRRRSGG